MSLIYRGEKPPRGFDDDMRDAVCASMQRARHRGAAGLRIHRLIEKRGDCRHAETSKGGKVDADQIMIAIGRRPNTAALHVERAGVELGKKGEVRVDEFSRTSAPHIWALGDVTDRLQLTPVAIHEAMCFVETAFRNNPTRPDHSHVPSAVFTTPELAAIGLTEEKALALGHPIDVYKSVFRPLLHTLGGREVRTLMKLVVNSSTGRVLGCHIFGDHASEIVQTAAIALRLGATKADFDRTIALHPTAAEELVTMRTQKLFTQPIVGAMVCPSPPVACAPGVRRITLSLGPPDLLAPLCGLVTMRTKGYSKSP